jgi:hypothetical protein
MNEWIKKEMLEYLQQNRIEVSTEEFDGCVAFADYIFNDRDECLALEIDYEVLSRNDRQKAYQMVARNLKR